MDYRSLVYDVHICGACRKEYNDYHEFAKHKETCSVLAELKKQGILNVNQSGTTDGIPNDREGSRKYGKVPNTENVTAKHVEIQPYQKSEVSTSVVPTLVTSNSSFITNVSSTTLSQHVDETVMPSHFVHPLGNNISENMQHVISDDVILTQVYQNPKHAVSNVTGGNSSHPQQVSNINICNQLPTPVGHEYARQNVEELEEKHRAVEMNNVHPVCQIVTMNNDRYLIITNTGQGDICIPINAENVDVLNLVQSFMKDSYDLALNSSPPKNSSDAKEQFTSQQQNAVSTANTKSLLSSSLDVGSTISETVYPVTHLERAIPKPEIQNICPGQMVNSTGGIQHSSQPTLQMQLDHSASFSLLPHSQVIPGILSESTPNSTHNQQHLTQESRQLLAGHSNQSSPCDSTAVTVPASDISVNPALTTADLTPLSISTESQNLPKLTDMQLTPNTVLNSLGNLSKYANTDGMENIGVDSLESISKQGDGHGNEVTGISEASLQNLEMSSVVYMGDNSYSVHFKTHNSGTTNLSTETLNVESQQPALNQSNEVIPSGHQGVEGQVKIKNQMVGSGVNVENGVVEGGSSLINEDEVQESQVVEQLHQAYLRTQQQTKEKQLSQQKQHRPKTRQTTGRSPENKQKHVRKKKFQCTIQGCSFVSAYMKDLERHMRVHTGERPYSCEYCNKSFSRMDKLRLHVRGHTGEKPFKCEFCNYRAVDNSSIKKHMAVHSNDKPIKCQTCSYACRTSSQLVVHLRRHTGDAPFSCLYCDSKFKIKSDMKRHMRTHTGEKPFKCEQCYFSCSAKSNLVSHYNVHHSSTKLTCDHCEFTTSSKRSFYEHQKTHSTPDPECICKVCHYVCSNKQTLKTHMSNAHNYKMYLCKDCNFCSKSMAKARRHYNTCGSIKKPSSHLKKAKRHRISRDDDSQGRNYEKNYVCDFCDEAFVRKDSLTSHVKLHRERTQSTLSTALTVLELQQPVINNTAAPPGVDHNYDMEVVTISSSMGQSRADHSYETFDKEISSSNLERQKEESPSEGRRTRRRNTTKSYRKDFVYDTQYKRKSSKPIRIHTTSLENFVKCKPSTSGALRASKNLELGRYEQYDSNQAGSQPGESQTQQTILPSLVVNASQRDQQNNTSSQNPQTETAVIPCSAPQTQNPNIQVVQNITVPIIQLNDGQLVAMQQVGNVSDQVFSLTPLAVNQVISGAAESSGESASSSKLPAEGLLSMFSPNTNSYISVLQQAISQQGQMTGNEAVTTNQSSLSNPYTTQVFPPQINAVQPSGDGVHNDQTLIVMDTNSLPSSTLPSAQPISKASATESSSTNAAQYKHKTKTSKRISISQGLDDSSSQIDVQSIELDDTSYDFNLQDSGLVSKETMGGRQLDL